jgi:uncharacterized protein (TIGR03437 family)
VNKCDCWIRNRACAVVLLCAAAAIASHAQVLTTLVNFNGTNGNAPSFGALIQGKDGNFYGTAQFGGGYPAGTVGSGTVFKVTPAGTLTVLHTFGMTPTDGVSPQSGLIQASDGNFYGTTEAGGQGVGAGTIYKITPDGTYSTLYNFCPQSGCPDGDGPYGPLLQASDGNLYGTTWYGGNFRYGVIFKITLAGRLTPLYSFCSVTTNGFCGDGANPLGGLMQASDGNLYGSTSLGGPLNTGTIFKLTLGGTFTSMHSFSYAHGGVQQPGFGLVTNNGMAAGSQLVQGADGNLYGTTVEGGVNQYGQVFKMALDGTFTTVYSFSCCQAGGMGAPNGLILAADGNFYGTTARGGTSLYPQDDGNGAIFKMTSQGTVTTLHIFGISDGQVPVAALVQGSDGNLYGTTYGEGPYPGQYIPDGGGNTQGTVFKLALQPTEPLCTPPLILSVNSAGAYGGYSYFASGSWLEIMGEGLTSPTDPRLAAATNPGQWTAKDFTGVNAPTILDGNSVSINGKPAYMWYLSPGQLNVQAPEDTATGNVDITVTNYCNATSPPYTLARKALAPGFLAPSSFTAGGTNYLAATFVSDGAYVLNSSLGTTLGINSRAAKPGDNIIAYGIGFGDVTPAILPGAMAEQANSVVDPVTISFGSTNATQLYSGLAGGFVGLYEFYITVPPGLANGDYQINATQNGTKVPQTVYLSVHN